MTAASVARPLSWCGICSIAWVSLADLLHPSAQNPTSSNNYGLAQNFRNQTNSGFFPFHYRFT
jgi:hypothetical protein